MNRIKLLIFSISPIIIGYIINLTVLVPGIGILLLYVMPVIILIYWFWVGMKFSERIRNPLVGIVGGNLFGILSLCIYYWQFIILDDQKRSMFLAGLSQFFTVPLSILTARFGMLFEKLPNTSTQITTNAMHVIGTLIMVMVFAIGYIFGKINNKKQKHSKDIKTQ